MRHLTVTERIVLAQLTRDAGAAEVLRCVAGVVCNDAVAIHEGDAFRTAINKLTQVIPLRKEDQEKRDQAEQDHMVQVEEAKEPAFKVGDTVRIVGSDSYGRDEYRGEPGVVVQASADEWPLRISKACVVRLDKRGMLADCDVVYPIRSLEAISGTPESSAAQESKLKPSPLGPRAREYHGLDGLNGLDEPLVLELPNTTGIRNLLRQLMGFTQDEVALAFAVPELQVAGKAFVDAVARKLGLS